MKRSLFLLQDSYVFDDELSVFGDRIDDGMEYSSLTRQEFCGKLGLLWSDDSVRVLTFLC